MKPRKIEIEGEPVFVKKDWAGWRIVHPNNFITGGKRNLVFLIYVLVIVVLFYLGIEQLISQYEAIANNPCDYCFECATPRYQTGWEGS